MRVAKGRIKTYYNITSAISSVHGSLKNQHRWFSQFYFQFLVTTRVAFIVYFNGLPTSFWSVKDYCHATRVRDGGNSLRIRAIARKYRYCCRAISWLRMTDRTILLPILTSLSRTCACVSWLIGSPFSLMITSPACRPAVWARPPIVTLSNKH